MCLCTITGWLAGGALGGGIPIRIGGIIVTVLQFLANTQLALGRPGDNEPIVTTRRPGNPLRISTV
jgi:hypothetical protein